MSLKLNGASSGHVILDAKANAGSYTLTLPSTGNGELVAADSSGNITISNGNLIVGTAGKGIDFSATADGTTMGSELLDDYEEGSFTATPVTGTLNAANNGCSYIKVGRQVSLGGQIRVSGANTAALKITLPFTAAANVNDDSHNFVGTLGTHSVNPPIEDGAPCAVFIDAGSTELQFVQHKGNQGWDSYSMTDGGYYRFSITYISA